MHSNSAWWLTFVVIASCIFVSTGCQRKAVVKQRRVSVAPTASKNSPFDVAFDFLNNLDQYQPDFVKVQVLDNLRDWSREEEAPVSWIADPMFSRLPQDLKKRYTTDTLATDAFELFDVIELRQAVWLRDVAQMVAKSPIYEPRINAWLENAVSEKTITKDDADDLSLAYRLFDWTVRNVQLDEELDAMDFVGGQETVDKRDPTTTRHQLYPWQSLLYGHGDCEERSRLFMLLARQLGVNAVMLIADRGDDQVRQTWACGVLLGSELYLFDAKLGIPMPGQGGAPFARLSDYVDHPELLDALNIDSQRYRIVKSDLKKLVASIDATPAALSQRMKLVESQLQRNRKMVLTVAPSPLAKRIRTCKHITNVEIWPFPYRGYQFIEQFKTEADITPELDVSLRIDQQPFNTRGSIMRGRLLQLKGFHRGDFDNPGAKKLYMDARLSKKELERFNIPFDRLPPESPLVANLPEDPIRRRQIFESRLQAGRQMAIRAKDIATFWLGTISMDQQKFKVATDFFKLNVADEKSRWKNSARYNLARAYEALGVRDKDEAMIQKAIELYEGSEDTPQRVGNLLRANRLSSN